jgi:TRAP-type C4-dicarboxylate transport system permease small subunit
VPLPLLFWERRQTVHFLERIPKIAATALISLAIVNLLIGVFLRYFVGGITNYMDWDPVPFTWVEEVGEMALAWLTLVGAAIGIRSRSHFTLHVLTPRLSPAVQACWPPTTRSTCAASTGR